MKETNMQTLFKKHLAQHPPVSSEVYELKICKGTSIPFDSVKAHQVESLLQAEGNGLFHKITDPPIFYGGKMRFNVPRPFDCMFLKHVEAYVVLWFYKPRQEKLFIKIPIAAFIHEKEISERKSLTEDRAKEIGTEFILSYAK